MKTFKLFFKKINTLIIKLVKLLRIKIKIFNKIIIGFKIMI
jgi:hypothetical protein